MLDVMSPPCRTDEYNSSDIEASFYRNVLNWTSNEASLCTHLTAEVRDAWISENKAGKSSGHLFSTICKRGEPPQVIEPLAGILRDPRFLCDGTDKLYSVEWLVTADDGLLRPGARKIMFDAGGSNFRDAMMFFTSHYEKRGIVFDFIFVWEAEKTGTDQYWRGVPKEVRQRWEPRLTFYDGILVTAEHGAEHNPLSRIKNMCQPDDFCVFKLDIDTPSVELPLVEQLLATPDTTLDEFFFEHHTHGLMQYARGKLIWGDNVNGTLLDSFDIFTKLRRMGVRAHPWI